MTIVEQKKKIRKEILSQRGIVEKESKEKYDQLICEAIRELIITRNFNFVHCYLPMSSEINIFPLIQFMLNQGIKVVTPKTLPKRQLENLLLNSLQELEEGVFGTCHPANSRIYLGQYDLIIVPGLAFDKKNFRLGYGGGYYDHFLANHVNAYKLGICYPFQKMEQIPLEKHDVQLDEVLSFPM
ncbi:MAG: 5-formyltetrahydrofolate cyclo-ligase [Saprospiraceae bacterium]